MVGGMKKKIVDKQTYARERKGSGAKNNTMRNNGPKFHSIYAEPVFPVTASMNHVTQPTLHIILGPVKKSFEYLKLIYRETATENIDGRDSNVERRKNQYKFKN